MILSITQNRLVRKSKLSTYYTIYTFIMIQLQSIVDNSKLEGLMKNFKLPSSLKYREQKKFKLLSYEKKFV